ncbi:MAG: hypothetical protein JO053_02730 [Acidobacteria bacterium]|nr:hypothetical protein [Acidobacteriota bacterium]
MTENIPFNRSAISAGECVTEAWEMIKRRYWIYVGASLLTLILTQYLYCISWVLLGPVTAGVYLMVLKDMREEPVEFGMMFKGFEKFVPLMIAGLVQGVPQVLGQLVGFAANIGSIIVPQPGRPSYATYQSNQPDMAAFPAFFGVLMVIIVVLVIFSILWYFSFCFVVPLTLEHNLPLVETMKLSARAGWANFGGLFLTALLIGLVGILGMILCFVGIFFVSIPVMFVTNAIVYRRVFPQLADTMNYMPPPPTAYGSAFGSGM